MWINISKSGNSFMAGRACYGGGERNVFTLHSEGKNPNNNRVAVFIYVFVNDLPRIGDEGVTERDEKKTC